MCIICVVLSKHIVVIYEGLHVVKHACFKGLKLAFTMFDPKCITFSKQIKIETNVLLRHKEKHSEITGAQSEKLGRESVSLSGVYNFIDAKNTIENKVTRMFSRLFQIDCMGANFLSPY